MIPNLFHRIIFRMFKPQMLLLSKIPHNVLEPQTRYNDERFEFVFYDSNGLAYYKVRDGHKTPALRMAYVLEAYIRFITAIEEADLTKALEQINKALHAKNAKGKMQPDIARIGYTVKMLQGRQGTIVHKELLCNMVAHSFMREDEAIEYIDDVIYQEKREFIMNQPGMLKDCFFNMGLAEAFPYLNDLQDLFDEVLLFSGQKLAAEATILNNG